jgi:hypothetical protein
MKNPREFHRLLLQRIRDNIQKEQTMKTAPSAPVLMGTVLEATGIAYPESRYTGTYTSPEGLQLLLQAIEVKVEGMLQVAADPEFADEVEALGTVAYQEGHLQTVDINGRTYVVCLTPYCS